MKWKVRLVLPTNMSTYDILAASITYEEGAGFALVCTAMLDQGKDKLKLLLQTMKK